MTSVRPRPLTARSWDRSINFLRKFHSPNGKELGRAIAPVHFSNIDCGGTNMGAEGIPQAQRRCTQKSRESPRRQSSRGQGAPRFPATPGGSSGRLMSVSILVPLRSAKTPPHLCSRCPSALTRRLPPLHNKHHRWVKNSSSSNS